MTAICPFRNQSAATKRESKKKPHGPERRMGLAANSQQAGRLESKSAQASVALLVFLAAAAWARIVTTHAWHFTLGCFIQTGIFTAQGSVVIRMMETNIGVGGCFNSRFLNLLRCLNAHGHQHFDHF